MTGTAVGVGKGVVQVGRANLSPKNVVNSKKSLPRAALGSSYLPRSVWVDFVCVFLPDFLKHQLEGLDRPLISIDLFVSKTMGFCRAMVYQNWRECEKIIYVQIPFQSGQSNVYPLVN